MENRIVERHSKDPPTHSSAFSLRNKREKALTGKVLVESAKLLNGAMDPAAHHYLSSLTQKTLTLWGFLR